MPKQVQKTYFAKHTERYPKMILKFKVEPTRAQGPPATPQASPSCPRPPPDPPKPLLVTILGLILQPFFFENGVQEAEKQYTAKYFHPAPDFDGKRDCDTLAIRFRTSLGLSLCVFNIPGVSTLSRKEGPLSPYLYMSYIHMGRAPPLEGGVQLPWRSGAGGGGAGPPPRAYRANDHRCHLPYENF